MEPDRIASSTALHPAAARERKLRRRVQFWATVVCAAVLIAGSAALLLWSAGKAGSFSKLLGPGLYIPVLLLTLMIVAAIYVKTAARQCAYILSGDGRTLRTDPGAVARWVRKDQPVGIDLSQVDRVQVMHRTAGTFVVFHQGETLLPVPLGMDAGDFYEQTLDGIPDYVPGLGDVRKIQADILAPRDYRSAVSTGAVDDPGHRDFEKILKCHEALGTWMLGARQLWQKVEAGKPDAELLGRLHRTERMRLCFTAMLTYLEKIQPLLPENDLVAADFLRVSLSFRFRGNANELLDRFASSESTGNGPKVPIDDWLKIRKHRPPFSGGIPVLSQRRLKIEDGHLVSVPGGAMPFEMLAAFTAVQGFAGTRIMRIYDAWGQRHDLEQHINVPGGLESLGFILMDLAPHVMELHESSTWSLGLRNKLRRLRRASEPG